MFGNFVVCLLNVGVIVKMEFCFNFIRCFLIFVENMCFGFEKYINGKNLLLVLIVIYLVVIVVVVIN